MVALRENIKQKRRGKLSAGVLLLHDNAPLHKSRTSQVAIMKCGFVFVELNHPACSPDLAPSDYFLFRNLENFLVGDDFPMIMQSRKLLTGYFGTQDVHFFSKGIRSLEAK